MRVMAIEQLYYKNDVFFKTKFLPEITKIFGRCQATVNNDNLIVLIGTDEDGEIPEAQMTEFKAYATNHKFIVGISNHFSKSKEIYSHYDQAIRTLHFGKQLTTKENIFFFRDYVYYALLDQVNDSNLFSYARHPALDILLRYDREKDANLYQTLQIYTRTGFNKIKTAELMFLHRNTVTYRIQHIEDLCGIDLSSMELLFPLQVSFLIDSYLNNRPI
jgi:DNA-binding PucR family transcriptional regulator